MWEAENVFALIHLSISLSFWPVVVAPLFWEIYLQLINCMIAIVFIHSFYHS